MPEPRKNARQTRLRCRAAALLVVIVSLPAPVLASDEADELLPGAALLVDATRQVMRFRARPATGTFDLPDLPDNDPTLEGATLEVFDAVAPGAGANVYRLPADGWTSLPSGGFRYRQPGFPLLQLQDSPCRVLITPSRVKGVCKLAVTLVAPFAADVQVVLTVGTDTKRYCATFGGTTVANGDGLLRRKGAGVGACLPIPCGGFLTMWGSPGAGDGQFDGPDGVTLDAGGNVYVPDLLNHRIQKFDANGTFLAKWGSFGTGDGQFDMPDGLAVDGNGNVYVADLGNDRVQKFDANGTFLTKWGSLGTGDGQFNGPAAAATAAGGAVYVADFFNNRVQKFDTNGTFLTKWGGPGSGDGQFIGPESVAVDGAGDVYVADIGNYRIQKFDADGTFLSKWGSAGSGPGQFDRVIDVAVDGSGDLYVADLGLTDVRNHRIQKFAPDGTFLTMWGGPGASAGQFNRPVGVAAASGQVYVADYFNNRIQKFACP